MASLVIKTFLVILLLLFMDISSGRRVKGFGEGVVKPAFPTDEGTIEKKVPRYLIAVDDYVKPGPNPRHGHDHDQKRLGGTKS